MVNQHRLNRRQQPSSWYLAGILLILVCLILTRRADAAGVAGNGTGYNGGDTEDRRLASAREGLVRSLTLIRLGYDVAGLCDPEACGVAEDNELCTTLRGMSKPQREECQHFILDTADETLRLNHGENRTAFKIDAKAMQVADPFGKMRAVTAMTQKGAEGPILFHHASLKTMSGDALVALLAHEFGHKAAQKDKTTVEDNSAVGHFKFGRELLDAVGAAMSVYAANHEDPIQPLPMAAFEMTDRPLCALASDRNAGFLLGLAIDAQHVALSTDRYKEWQLALQSRLQNKADNARFLFVQDVLSRAEAHAETTRALFRKFQQRDATAEEVAAILKRVSAPSYESLLAEVLAEPSYQRKGKGNDSFVNDLYLDLLGRPARPEEVAAGTKQLAQGTRAAFVTNLLHGNEEAQSRLLRAWYETYLERAPSVTETLFQMNRLKAGVQWQTLHALLLSSDEYVSLQHARFFPGGDKYECAAKGKVAGR